MAIKLKKSYKFALRSSLVITILITLVFIGFHMDVDHIDWSHTLLFALICFAICFAIIQIRVERFIYRRIKRIYDDVSLLESSSPEHSVAGAVETVSPTARTCAFRRCASPLPLPSWRLVVSCTARPYEPSIVPSGRNE